MIRRFDTRPKHEFARIFIKFGLRLETGRDSCIPFDDEPFTKATCRNRHYDPRRCRRRPERVYRNSCRRTVLSGDVYVLTGIDRDTLPLISATAS